MRGRQRRDNDITYQYDTIRGKEIKNAKIYRREVSKISHDYGNRNTKAALTNKEEMERRVETNRYENGGRNRKKSL